MTPTVAHCVWLPAPRGGRALLGAALRGGDLEANLCPEVSGV